MESMSENFSITTAFLDHGIMGEQVFRQISPSTFLPNQKINK